MESIKVQGKFRLMSSYANGSRFLKVIQKSTSRFYFFPVTASTQERLKRQETFCLLRGDQLTFLQGLGLTSNDALNCLLCTAVRMVRGRLGPLLPSRGREEEEEVSIMKSSEVPEKKEISVQTGINGAISRHLLSPIY